MNIKSKIRETLREQYGDFETHLEHIYEDKVIKILAGNNIGSKKRWITYNQVILELKNSLKDSLSVKKLQYELTDNLDPNTACMEAIKGAKDSSPELDRLYHKIKNFI